MSALLGRIKANLRPDAEWSLDVDLRYLPVAQFIRENAPGALLLEIGSSARGITPYVTNNVIGCDATFPASISEQLAPVIARGVTPFRDRSFDLVLSLDTLEHVPREHRAAFVGELLRTSKRYVVVGFPEGEDAERLDSTLETYYTRHHGSPHEYFVEHREYRIPRPGEFAQYVHDAADRLGMDATLIARKNVNAWLRGVFMRLVWGHSAILQNVYHGLSSIANRNRLFHWGKCYRMIYYITLSQRPDRKTDGHQ